MQLELANAWLKRNHVGFSDIHQLVVKCRDGARDAGRESVALVLLAERAAAFSDRHEGVAVSADVVDEFLSEMRRETQFLLKASKSSDEMFLSALSAFAARLAPTLAV
jgi:uncharacterized hydantoinase/oxoprolinase family protein